MTNNELLERAGFRRPEPAFTKPDPRGLEYGAIYAEFDYRRPGSPIKVYKTDFEGHEVWSMYFIKYTHFENWAADCT